MFISDESYGGLLHFFADPMSGRILAQFWSKMLPANQNVKLTINLTIDLELNQGFFYFLCTYSHPRK